MTMRLPTVRRCLLRLAAILALAFAGFSGAAAQAPGATTPGDAPPKVQELLELLDDESVRGWIRARRVAPDPPAAAEPPADATPAGYMAKRAVVVRQHFASLAAALPQLPAAFARAGGALAEEFDRQGVTSVLLLVVAFVAMGVGAEWFIRSMTAGSRRWLDTQETATVKGRVRAVMLRLVYEAGLVAASAAGCFAAILVFTWPPLLAAVVIGYFIAVVGLRLALVAGRFLFAPPRPSLPDGDRPRVMPLDAEAAGFWHRRLVLFVGWLAFGWVTVSLLDMLGFPPPARRLIAYMLGLGLLSIALETIWHRPSPAPRDVAGDAVRVGRMTRSARSWLLSAYVVLLWMLWVASALPIFWLAVVAGGLPAGIGATQRCIYHLLRPADVADAPAQPPGIAAASLARGIRALLFIGAALLLAWKWNIDVATLASNETIYTRLLRGSLDAIVIVLVTDFVWHVVKAVIESRIAASLQPGAVDPIEARRRARIRTLLPIVRNVMFAVLLAMGGLMTLSALGVEIGPLIAGAGVVGVAIGFGAQTLVKDVISGMFFLLDDAFRIGEYIQSDKYKGTVESFSLRSIKLRHQRGSLFTVPFGDMGAVQNMSRDWVIDKLTVGVTFDSDLEKARKVIKQIGLDLAQDPEYAPHILEPLKLQGIDQFGDFAIQLRLKMMTKPGEQFVIRRRAYALIRKAFNENGIKFAVPTVQVAGGGAEATAAARQVLDAAKAQPAN